MAEIPQTIAIAGAALAVVFGIVTAVQRRRSKAAWAFGTGMLALGFEQTMIALSLQADGASVTDRWLQARLAATPATVVPWLYFSLTYARGKSNEVLGRNRVIIAVAFGLVSVALALFASPLARPVEGRSGSFALSLAGHAQQLVIILSSILILLALESTYRSAIGTLRWQIKYMLLGVAVLFAFRLYESSQSLLVGSLELNADVFGSSILLIAIALMAVAFWRTSGGEVELYPSNAVLSNSITILASGIYLFLVGSFAKVVSIVGGPAALPIKAFGLIVSLAILAVLLLSDRVRGRTKSFVSRHFQRPLFDYRGLWNEFSERTLSISEDKPFCREMVRLIADFFQTQSVSVWLIDEKSHKTRLGASTAVSQSDGAKQSVSADDLSQIVEYFKQSNDLLDIERSRLPWAERLKDAHPKRFASGGNRLVVPIRNENQILGLIAVGDRTHQPVFTQQDRDALKAVSRYAATGLANIQLSETLVQHKEMEAFQSMAAFFVHDLKNAASTLNLMVRNLPHHWQDEAFRTDALRGIATTGERINALISRLGQLRHELALELELSSIESIVERCLAQWQKPSGLRLTLQLDPTKAIQVDFKQMAKVIENIFKNAAEAMPLGGKLSVRTRSRPGWVTVAFSDEGEGMEQDFVERFLFKPFSTTKKGGLGIGMFQSKMIVEAHGGRMLVRSAPKQGATFEIHLPA